MGESGCCVNTAVTDHNRLFQDDTRPLEGWPARLPPAPPAFSLKHTNMTKQHRPVRPYVSLSLTHTRTHTHARARYVQMQPLSCRSRHVPSGSCAVPGLLACVRNKRRLCCDDKITLIRRINLWLCWQGLDATLHNAILFFLLFFVG